MKICVYCHEQVMTDDTGLLVHLGSGSALNISRIGPRLAVIHMALSIEIARPDQMGLPAFPPPVLEEPTP